MGSPETYKLHTLYEVTSQQDSPSAYTDNFTEKALFSSSHQSNSHSPTKVGDEDDQFEEISLPPVPTRTSTRKRIVCFTACTLIIAIAMCVALGLSSENLPQLLAGGKNETTT